MTLPRFEYVAAHTVDEAVALWNEQTHARYLAGGTDLVPRMRFAGQRPSRLVDVKGVEALRTVRERPDGAVSIGAAVTVAEVAAHPLIRERYPALATCCRSLGSYPLRQRATVAGNLCNASPCADTAAALLALDARVETVGRRGERTVELTELFTGPGETVMRSGELMTQVVLPRETAGAREAYGRLARRKGVDISTVAVLLVHVEGQQPSHRISLLSVAPTPLRVPEAEAILDQEGAAGAARAAEAARTACSPITDVRGTAEYRRDMVGVLLERGVRTLTSPGKE